MPSIDSDRIIKEYWEEVKEKYPNFTPEQFEKACKAPFGFFKTQMEKEDTPVIHIKGLGKFTVFSGYIKTVIGRNSHRYKKGTISREAYEERDQSYQKKLKEALRHEHSKRIIKGKERPNEDD